MFPYNFNSSAPIGDPAGRNMGIFPRLDPDQDLTLRLYPEEVREALEARKDEIHSAADLRDIADEEMLKR